MFHKEMLYISHVYYTQMPLQDPLIEILAPHREVTSINYFVRPFYSSESVRPMLYALLSLHGAIFVLKKYIF